MLPTSRYIGGITRPRDLRVITKSKGGHLDGLKVDQSLSAGRATLPSSDRVPSSSRELLQRCNSDCALADPLQKSEGCTALLCEINPAPLVQPRTVPGTHLDTSLLAHSGPQLSSVSPQARGFHTSSRVPYNSTSYNVTDVPDFFVKYKQHRATLSTDSKVVERGRDGLGLMQTLTDSILSDDVVATTRRLRSKIPVEHHVSEGHIVHPSGFVVPGPGHTSTSDVARAKERERNENIDRAVQTAAVAHRVLESDFEQVDATTLPSSHKVPFEVREPDGTVKHPSGFMPPTPAHKFRYTVSPSVLRDRKVAVAQQRVRQPSPSRAVLRAMHTASAPKAPGDV